jgi:hypothetical protein
MPSDGIHSPVKTCNDALWGVVFFLQHKFLLNHFFGPSLPTCDLFATLFFLEERFWKQGKMEREGKADKVVNLYRIHDRLKDMTICCEGFSMKSMCDKNKSVHTHVLRISKL